MDIVPMHILLGYIASMHYYHYVMIAQWTCANLHYIRLAIVLTITLLPRYWHEALLFLYSNIVC